MFKFKDEEEVLRESLQEKEMEIIRLEGELRKLKSKERLISQINPIINRAAVSDDLYKTLFLYITELMDEIGGSNKIEIFKIKEYMENLLDNIQVEIFVGEDLYSLNRENSVDEEKELTKEAIESLYNLKTTKNLDITNLLEVIESKINLVEISDIKIKELGITNCLGLAVWTMPKLLDLIPGFIVFLLGGNRYLTPVEKEVIKVFANILSPIINGKLLIKRVAEEAALANSMATTDALTKLWNRKCFHDDFVDNEEVKATDYYICFLDLCKLKQVNDVYGHDTADEVLKELANRMRDFAEDIGGKAYRLAGDEFIALIPQSVGDGDVKIAAQAFQDLWRTLEFEGVNKDNHLGITEKFKSNISLGVYKSENPAEDKESAVSIADSLMYISKSDRVNYKIEYSF